ncbi:helix-turn-helix domain-containing protein [Yoonia sp. R2331]|uniref:helix-turn-helix domain-containing protein n=1 Tax=Yoonia sp. R2331 TaxID=3237238 RepID=UPI0034E50CA7
MTQARHQFSFIPRLMQASAAAAYIGMSESKLREKKIPRKKDGGNWVYEKADLDAYADSLRYEGEPEGPNSCDEAFGS